MVFISNVLMIIALIGLIVSKNIYETYVWLFIDGMAFAGRILVSCTYYIEFAPESMKETGPFIL